MGKATRSSGYPEATLFFNIIVMLDIVDALEDATSTCLKYLANPGKRFFDYFRNFCVSQSLPFLLSDTARLPSEGCVRALLSAILCFKKVYVVRF